MSVLKSFLGLTAALVAVFSVLVYFTFIKKVPGPILKFRDGEAQGIILQSRQGREFTAYIGLPFAKPPLGKLRFEPPQVVEKWAGVWDASYYRPWCLQLAFQIGGYKLGSEDCLYLNVFIPKTVSSGEKKLPVMAHIHGGYFHMGSSEGAGARYFMDHDVILVTFNYRLGALGKLYQFNDLDVAKYVLVGFLNSGDGVIKGNMGLMDQNLALKWIQKNCETFGGDPQSVTILGESAGGASVHYHMLSPASKGLFSRAIRQSGSALNYWVLYRSSKSQAQRFAKKFNCPTDNSEKMAECLKDLDAQTLLDGHQDMKEYLTPLAGKFVPSIEFVKDENAFLTEEPIELIKSGRYNKVPALLGFNSDEGLLHSTCLFANQTKLDEVEDWFKWAPKAFHYDPKLTQVSQKLRDFYFGSDKKHLNSKDLIKNLTNLYGDRLFTVGVSQSALEERKHGQVYAYLFEYEGGFNIGTLIGFSQAKIHPIVDLILERLRYAYVTFILGQEYKHDVPGTSHGDEYPLLFSSLIEYLYMREKDHEMSKSMVQLWVDFATDKKPLQFRGVEFLPNTAESGELKFLHLKEMGSRMINEPFKERRLLWESLNIPSE